MYRYLSINVFGVHYIHAQDVKKQLQGPLGSVTMLAFRRPASVRNEEDFYYALELVRNFVEADTDFNQPQVAKICVQICGLYLRPCEKVGRCRVLVCGARRVDRLLLAYKLCACPLPCAFLHDGVPVGCV